MPYLEGKTMKTSHVVSFTLLLLMALVSSACGQNATPVTYKTVSEGALKPGSAIPAPSGEVVLTLDGNISQTNQENTLALDMETLESIGLIEYKVDDPFLKRNILYTGVLLTKLLEVAGADKNATTMKLWALDDYSVDMKIADAYKWPVIIATKADGAYIPLDQNGPLISVFPFNDFPEIDHLTYDNQWLWALAKITVK